MLTDVILDERSRRSSVVSTTEIEAALEAIQIPDSPYPDPPSPPPPIKSEVDVSKRIRAIKKKLGQIDLRKIDAANGKVIIKFCRIFVTTFVKSRVSSTES